MNKNTKKTDEHAPAANSSRILWEGGPWIVIDPKLYEDLSIQSLAPHELLNQHSKLKTEILQIQCRLTQIHLNLQKRRIHECVLPEFLYPPGTRMQV